MKEKPHWRECHNPRCKDATIGFFCYSCRYTFRWGMFIGGLIAGIILTIIKASQ